MYASVSLSTLRAGAALHSCHDPNDASTKLLGAGIEITEPFLKRLRERGIRNVIVGNYDLARLNAYKPRGTAPKAPLAHDYVQSLLTSDDSDELGVAVSQPDTMQPDSYDEPFSARMESRNFGRYDTESECRFNDVHDEAMTYVEGLFSELVTGNRPMLSNCRMSATGRCNAFCRIPTCLPAGESIRIPRTIPAAIACSSPR